MRSQMGCWRGSLATAAWCVFGMAAVLGFQAELLAAKEPVTRTGRRSSATQASAEEGQAEYSAELKRLQAKMDQILANQDEMLQRFDAIMEELRIIKIRATLR